MNDKTPAEMAKEIREFFNTPDFKITVELLELIHTAVVAAKQIND